MAALYLTMTRNKEAIAIIGSVAIACLILAFSPEFETARAVFAAIFADGGFFFPKR
jgi:hypothetical protein